MCKHNFLTIILLIFALLLCGCQKSPVPEAQLSETTLPEGYHSPLPLFHIELPDDMERVSDSSTQDTILRNGEVVGGILVLNVSRACVEDPGSSGELETYLFDTVMPAIDPRENGYDYLLSYGSLSHVAATASFYTPGDRIKYTHYVCLGEEAVYDLWLNVTLLGDDTDYDISRSITID